MKGNRIIKYKGILPAGRRVCCWLWAKKQTAKSSMMNKCRSSKKSSSAFVFFILPFSSLPAWRQARLWILACYLWLILLLAGRGEAFSQGFDSLCVSFHKKPRLIVGVATKTTFINGFRSPVFTARAGVEFNRIVRMGLGVSWIKVSRYRADRNNTPFYLDKVLSDTSGIHTVHPKLELRYVHVFFEYVYFHSRRWQFSIPLQAGAGNSRYKYNYNGQIITESPHWILLYEPAVSGQYKPLSWLGLGFDVGLRIMVVTNRHIGYKFNSPVYDLRAVIFWGELYRMAFPKGGLT
jgi:hypothetical protein